MPCPAIPSAMRMRHRFSDILTRSMVFRAPPLLSCINSGEFDSGCLLISTDLAQAEHAQTGTDHMKRDWSPELAQPGESLFVGEDPFHEGHDSYHPDRQQRDQGSG
jgi:hypothetical protein